MKVLLTADTLGGVWTYAIDLARSLSTRGVEIALATMGASVSEGQRKQLHALDNVTLFESNYKPEWMNDPWQDVRRSGEWLLEIEKRFEADVVHLNGYAHGSLPFQAPKMVVGHSCVLSWWEACRGEAAPAEWDRYRQEVRSGLSAADLVVAPTHAMLAALDRHYGLPRKCRVIPNGRRRPRYLKTYAKEPIVLAAGRLWDEAKNLATLDAAAASLDRPVYVAGDHHHPDGGITTPAAVKLLGKLEESMLADWYSRAAIYALPARYEPFGLSILEAAIHGCALVLGDIPSLRENWDGAAEFVPPNDAHRLRQSIQRLMDDPQRRRALSQRSIKRARRFTLDACADSYFTVYRDLLGSTAEIPPTRSAYVCVS